MAVIGWIGTTRTKGGVA